MLYDDPTGIDETVKQEALDFVRFNISQMLKYPNQFRVVEETVEHIDLKDIDLYLQKMEKDQDLDIKDLLIESVNITDIGKFAQICDYLEIDKVNYPLRHPQRIYFLESADSAITFIPIELDNRSVSIYIEPLESSPDLITELWAINRDKKKKSLEDIEFVNPRDLQSRSKK
ncbi:MAG: seg [candidate division WS6 bacterium 36_33]|uniref:Seg n=1 Tax=candidate division WS6 bacterium 36_33 TaxID=1641388 RepID=A0A101GZ54_9BACT|nr:MAG: seg [candidate division WS6 bacterium 36_33]